MISINIKVTKMEMTDFDQKKYLGMINIHYNDGSEKVISKVMKLDNCEDLAYSLLLEIRDSVKKENASKAQEDGDFLFVKFDLEEEELVKRMKAFLERANDRIKGMRQYRQAEGYLDKLNASKRFSMVIQ